MPIYEYRCKECQQVFEEWRKHVEDEDVTHNCPICKGPAQRLVSHTSFALKGGGWYVTEYGSRKNESASCSKPASSDTSTTKAADSATTPAAPAASGSTTSTVS